MRMLKRDRRNRRGFTLILMMLLMTVFIGAAAFATDFGKMYLIRGQLQAAADAGALAGIYVVAQGWKDSTVDTARAYTAKHKVGTAFYVGAPRSVAPGNWKDTAVCSPAGSCSAFVGNGNNWNAGGIDAVRVIVNSTATYNFGRYFGFTNRTLVPTQRSPFAEARNVDVRSAMGDSLFAIAQYALSDSAAQGSSDVQSRHLRCQTTARDDNPQQYGAQGGIGRRFDSKRRVLRR